MTVKLHFTLYSKDGEEFEDNIIIRGEDIEEVRAQAKVEMDARNLTFDKNHIWSEELD